MAGKGGEKPRARRAASPAGKVAASRKLASPAPEPSETSSPAANINVPAEPAPRLYLVNPLLAGPLPDWEALFAHIAALGCDAALSAPVTVPGGDGNLFRIGDPDAPHPCLEASGDLTVAVAHLAEMARRQGLALYLDLILDRVAADGAFVARHPGWFGYSPATGLPDPRQAEREPGTATARLEESGLVEDWLARLRRLAEAGVAGFRCLSPAAVPAFVWQRLIAELPQCRFMAWTPGLPAEAMEGLVGLGFAACFDSLAWWDLHGEWLVEEARRLAMVAPVIATVEPPFDGPRLASAQMDPAAAERGARRQLALAAGLGAGMLLSMGFEYGARRPLDPVRDRPGDWAWLRANPGYELGQAIRSANAALARRTLLPAEVTPLTGAGAPTVALLRRDAEGAELVAANASLQSEASLAVAAVLPGAGLPLARLIPEQGQPLSPGEVLRLAPGAVARLRAEPARPVLLARQPERGKRAASEVESAIAAAQAPRIAIEAVTPVVEGGRFAVKRLVGQAVTVECDLICDGHDKLGAALQWRAADETNWQEVRLSPLGNDRWVASFPLEHLGRHLFRIEAWRDAFASYRDELEKKHTAGLEISLELEEGRLLLARAGERAGGALAELAAKLASAGGSERLYSLLAADTARLMAEADDRPFRVRSAEMPVEAERTAAAFSAWFEIFPRNYGGLRGVIAQLPHIRAMGFDVLYFPPVHPIGRTHRKGRNNSLTPAPDDPGSPYAIGSEEGGHDALHPELGTLEDFSALREAAARHGLELALDFAIQCSPDHPWLKQHPDWFDWRPDGSLRYAENPPKKYQDIVNVDFYQEGAVPSLWLALRDVVLFWLRQGVRIFRVDNPHTKPLPFWEWLIAEVRGRHPETIFLAEAFTRPKMMYRLGKVGFSQSYSYFTWRNTKREIIEYLEELASPPVADIYRPHFFVNTPDINPPFLQTGGRAAHLIRAALAATTAGLWGVFQGFELCDATPLAGREEYLNSDKYEIRQRPQRARGDIVDEITRLNAIRRANPALQRQMAVAFHNAFNDQVLWFRREDAERSNVLLVAISLDPFHAQDTMVELPLWEWGLPDSAALEAEDLMRGYRFTWQGKQQWMRLDPAGLPFGIWRVHPAGGVT
jgi:starch synthase (maltosyl-transferring)